MKHIIKYLVIQMYKPYFSTLELYLKNLALLVELEIHPFLTRKILSLTTWFKCQDRNNINLLRKTIMILIKELDR